MISSFGRLRSGRALGLVLWTGWALLAPISPAPAQGSRIAAEVVEMLEADLSEEVIVDWLETRPGGVERPSAADLVRLEVAGASDDLMRHLLALARRDGSAASAGVESPAVESPEVGPGEVESSEVEPSRESSGTTAPTTPAPTSTPSGAGASGEALVTFALSYLSRVDEEEVGAVREWDLYVYLDGYPLSYMKGAGLWNRASEMEFLRSLPAGRHSLRVIQERHFRRGGAWRHETRVAREDFEFDLRPGVPARIEVEFVERLMDYRNPLLYKMAQGGDLLDSGRVGGEAELWPALCEDIEASVTAGKKPNRRQRRRLEDCVGWKTLWVGGAPSRLEVLEAMADFDFRPQPKGS